MRDKNLLPDKKMLFIVNPKAGKKALKSSLIHIIQIFSKAGYKVDLYPTSRNNEKNQAYICAVGDQYDMVVCAGGDGTLDNTVTAIMKLQKMLHRRVHMGYIPCGSTNDYARSLKISLHPTMAALQIVKGDICHVDIGRLENDYFIYIAAFGIFTDVSYSTPQKLKNHLGHVAYILQAVKTLANVKSYHTKVWMDGEIVEGDFIYGQVTNSLSVGGFKNFGSSDNMSFCDGKFEAVFIRRPKNVVELQRVVSHILASNLDDELIVFRKASKIIVKSNEEISWTLDGEYGGKFKNTRIANLNKAVSLTLEDKSKFF